MSNVDASLRQAPLGRLCLCRVESLAISARVSGLKQGTFKDVRHLVSAQIHVTHTLIGSDQVIRRDEVAHNITCVRAPVLDVIAHLLQRRPMPKIGVYLARPFDELPREGGVIDDEFTGPQGRPIAGGPIFHDFYIAAAF